MTGQGRRASLPPAEHVRPAARQQGSLVVHHHNRDGQVRTYDFAVLPVGAAMQHSLAELFAARCYPERWSTHATSENNWRNLKGFTEFLAAQLAPPQDLEQVSGVLIDRWWDLVRSSIGGRRMFTDVRSLLRDDARLQTGPAAEALARRVPSAKGSRTQSYSRAEFDEITTTARRMFRAALLRIETNAAYLEQWRAGQCGPDRRHQVIGEALELLARNGELPHQAGPSGVINLVSKYRWALGGQATSRTWQRLFLTRMEATALGVLLMAEFGWNLSVVSRAEVPKATPDPGPDGRPTYRVPVHKRRRGTGHWYDTENVTDTSADSPGRLITQALAATRFARAVVEDMAPGTDLLVVWRSAGQRTKPNQERPSPVGPFCFGLSGNEAHDWAESQGLSGSPFQRGRRTVAAINRREPIGHTQATHDRDYALPDHQAQAAAVTVIADGAEAAVTSAQSAVLLVAELRSERDPAHLETATADCSGVDASPSTGEDGGCAASFLLCLACPNARIHTDHHPRLVHLHAALSNLRSVTPAQRWKRDWEATHARLEDLRDKIGPGGWARAQDRVADGDRAMINTLLIGDLDA